MGKMCYRCMMPSVEGGICTRCGEPELGPDGNGNNALPPGTRLLNGRLVIGKRLGTGGFGVTYIALDQKAQRRVALKEFMPNYLAVRQGVRVVPKPDQDQAYTKAMSSFMKEARALYELREHPNIVHVLYAFKENGTAYYGMELLEGESLLEYLKRKRKVSAGEAYKMLSPVMDAIAYVHSKKILHRDISPDNIMLCRDASNPDVVMPKLIDFGAAHVAIQGFSLSYPGVKKNGFSSLEQNWDGNCQGPWTDVYSFCATFYGAIVGNVPVPAMDRAEADTDPLKPPSQLGADISPELEAALMRGMKLRYQERTQSMPELKRDMQKALNEESVRKGSGTIITTHGGNEYISGKPPKRPVGRRVCAWLLEQGVQGVFQGILLGSVLDSLAGGRLGLTALLRQIPSLSLLIPAMVFFLDLILLLGAGGTLGQLIFGLKVEKDDSSGGPGFGSSLVYSLFYASYGSLIGFLCGIVWLSSGKDIGPLERLVGVTVGLRKKPKISYDPGQVYMPSRENPPADSGGRYPAPVSRPQPPVPQPPKPQPPKPQDSAPRRMAGLVCLKACEQAAACKGKTISLAAGDTLGKSSAKAKVVVPDPTVSSLHCSFHFSMERGWMIKDEDSRNGTYVNDRRLPPMGYAPLVSGSIIRVGKEEFEFKC